MAENTKITMEEIGQAHEWLANNKDKWKDFCGFQFLVPLTEIPEVVIKYRKFEEENDKAITEQNQLLEKMGVL